MIISGFTQEESRHTHGDENCHHVLIVLVLLVADHLPHQHDGDHLARLRQHLGGEADVLEGLVLAPTGHDVGEGTVAVLVKWSSVFGLPLEHHDQNCNHEGQDPVDKH